MDVNYGRNDEEHIDIIYHQSSLLNSYEPDQTQLRIITAKDPRMALIFPITEDNNLKIYEFKGHIEQIKHRKRFKFYILRCERNDRQIFA